MHNQEVMTAKQQFSRCDNGCGYPPAGGPNQDFDYGGEGDAPNSNFGNQQNPYGQNGGYGQQPGFPNGQAGAGFQNQPCGANGGFPGGNQGQYPPGNGAYPGPGQGGFPQQGPGGFPPNQGGGYPHNPYGQGSPYNQGPYGRPQYATKDKKNGGKATAAKGAKKPSVPQRNPKSLKKRVG